MPRLGLPSAQRTVTRGVTLCIRMGYDQDQALHLIMTACSAALTHAVDLGEVDPAWLAAVYSEAALRHVRLTVKTTSPMSGRGQPEETGA